jgi:hypothetical protein
MTSREQIERVTNQIVDSQRKQGKQVNREQIRERVVRQALISENKKNSK